MTNTIHKNELTKRRFYDYLRNSKGFSKTTIECFESAIWLWEDFSGQADFVGFNKTKAEEFKAWLKGKKKARSQENVSLSYCYDNLRHLKTLFDWLSKQSGYKKITQTDVDYLNLSKGDARIATQPKGRIAPTLDQVKVVIEHIGDKTEIEMRDKALLSLTFLTGARISAIASLPMRSFDKERLVIDQDPKWGVKTKFSKRIVSSLVPFLYKKPLDYFLDWFNYLEKKNFKPEDPIFPATKIENGKKNLGYFNTGEVEATFWQSTSTPRKIFEKRFAQAGVKYFHPHTFRHLLIKEISKLPLTEEQKKAISQSLGHEDVATTFGSYGYGKIQEDRQIEIVRDIDFGGKSHSIKYQLGEEDIQKILRRAKENEQK